MTASKYDAAILALLEHYADHGLPCPTKGEIASQVGGSYPSLVTAALVRLTRRGRIEFEYWRRQHTAYRPSRARLRVLIKASGKRTAVPGPDWVMAKAYKPTRHAELYRMTMHMTEHHIAALYAQRTYEDDQRALRDGRWVL